LQSEASWIYLPELIKLSYSDDGVSYFLISDNVSKSFGEENRLIKLDIKSFETRFVKIVLHPVNPIPPGFPGAGNTSWLFIDELIIR
jgi:hexosaminidase